MKHAVSQKIPLVRAICLLAVIGVFAAAPALAGAQARPRVINGTSAPEGAWPWMVSLHLADDSPSRSHFCGGVLIESRHVLTAAHCVADYVETPGDIAVSTGHVRLTAQPLVSSFVEGVVIHPSFSGEFSVDNDIALVKLSTPLPGPTLSIIADGLESLQAAGTSAMVLGWGSLDPDFAVRPDILQQAEVPIVEETQCEQRLGLDYNRETMMCAGKLAESPLSGDGVDACFGDSGGPLIVWDGGEWRLVGIVSWGLYCGSHRYWGVYSRVFKFKDWILSLPGLAPRSLAEPQISGAPIVGEKLRCLPGDWSGDGPLQFRYHWRDSAGKTLRGKGDAESASYKIKASDVGRKIICRVSALNSAGASEAASSKAGPVFPQKMRNKLSGKGQKLIRASALSCKGTQCRLLLTLKDPSLTLGDALVLSGGPAQSAKWRKAQQVSKNSWLIVFIKSSRAEYDLFVRVYGGGDSRALELSFRL